MHARSGAAAAGAGQSAEQTSAAEDLRQPTCPACCAFANHQRGTKRAMPMRGPIGTSLVGPARAAAQRDRTGGNHAMNPRMHTVHEP
jgi:hypothetical protein